MYDLIDVILIALAMVLMLEGFGPMFFVNKWQRYLQQVAQQPASQLRTMGGVLFIIGALSLFYLL